MNCSLLYINCQRKEYHVQKLQDTNKKISLNKRNLRKAARSMVIFS